jgi:DNA-binding transcriptional LysR family regulator
MLPRQLEYLVALDEEQHFSRAAHHGNVSQPTLSNAIKQLEAELSTPIMLRDQRLQSPGGPLYGNGATDRLIRARRSGGR